MMLNRRSFLHSLGMGATVYFFGRLPVQADALDLPNFDPHMPADKGLKSDWVRSLFARGVPQAYSKDALRNIQMPISGICTGQELNLSGEGALAGWRVHATPLDIVQGFSLRTNIGGKTETHLLNQGNFPDMTFRGEYPIAKLEYANAATTLGATAKLAGNSIPVTCRIDGDRALLTFAPGLTIAQGQQFSVELA